MQQEFVTSSTPLRHGARIVPPGFLATLPAIAAMPAPGAHRRVSGGDAACAKPEHIARRVTRAIPAMEFSDVRVAAAESEAELQAAHELVRERYRWRGYDFDRGGERRAAGSDVRATREITFVAANREVALGTLTLRIDGPLGLYAEETHRDVVQGARAAGARVCELTRLALADGVSSRAVLAALFNLAYAAGDTLHGVTDVFIEVNPRHVAFYSRVLGFAAVAEESFCDRVRAPSVLLHVEKKALAGRLRSLARRALLPPVLSRTA